MASGAAEAPALRVVAQDSYPSWEEVYRDNVERMYALMFLKVGNRPDAEDLTATVFLSALPRLRMSAAAAEVRAYLYAVARTVLADHWRRTLGRQITAIDPDLLAQTATDGAARQETAELVRRTLQALPDRYRTILQLRFLESATLREAARRMEITVANAKVLQHRALRHAARIIDGVR